MVDVSASRVAERFLADRDSSFTGELRRIGEAIGYGNAQHILGRLWDETLLRDYGVSGRGQMGVTVDDGVPPVPKATRTRRQQRANGGYEMVPAYTAKEMKDYARMTLEWKARNHD